MEFIFFLLFSLPYSRTTVSSLVLSYLLVPSSVYLVHNCQITLKLSGIYLPQISHISLWHTESIITATNISWVLNYDRHCGIIWLYIPSVQFSRSVVSDSLWPHGLQHASSVHHQLLEPTQTHVHWVSDTIQPSHPLSSPSPPRNFPASGSFQMSQLFASGGQSIGVSASTSVLPKNTQDWSPLGWTGWISLQSKGLSRVFSNTTVQKHQFFGTQLSL